MKIYYGTRTKAGCEVRCEDYTERRERTLPRRLDLFNYSPLGFEWGYAGSGPDQLALALLADATGDDALAVRLHQDFKFSFVTKWTGEEFRVCQSTILDWVRQWEADE